MVFAKASLVLPAAETSRRYDASTPDMWLPGKVQSCYAKPSATDGKSLTRFMSVQWFLGGTSTTTKEVCLSSAKLELPEGKLVPTVTTVNEDELETQRPVVDDENADPNSVGHINKAREDYGVLLSVHLDLR